MSQLVLEFHKWRKMKPGEGDAHAAMFLFSLLPRDAYEAGRRPTHNECFWTEVTLSEHLAEQDAWKRLDKNAMLGGMFHHAVEQIRQAGRMLRTAPMFWTTTNGLERGPGEGAPKSVPSRFEPLLIDVDPAASPRFTAREGAGLAS